MSTTKGQTDSPYPHFLLYQQLFALSSNVINKKKITYYCHNSQALLTFLKACCKGFAAWRLPGKIFQQQKSINLLPSPEHPTEQHTTLFPHVQVASTCVLNTKQFKFDSKVTRHTKVSKISMKKHQPLIRINIYY